MLRLRTKKQQQVLFFVVMTILLVVGLVIDINAGYTKLTAQDFISLLNGTASKQIKLTLINFRLPRIITVFLVGIGLSVSGCIMQGVTRNELADPNVLGINAGAALMVALYIVIFSKSLQSGSIGIPLVSMIGSVVSIILVYVLSLKKGAGISPNRMVLTGIAIASALNSVTIMLLLKMRQDEYGFIAGWMSGNLWGISWNNIKIMFPWIFVLLGLAMYKSNTLNILSLGEQTAIGLGVDIQKQSLILLLISVGLSSICVAVGGGIAFVGLVSPHLARYLVGSRHQVLIPATALTGAVLLVVSDIISRTIISPSEVSIGIVSTIIGAPYFLYLLTGANNRKKNRR